MANKDVADRVARLIAAREKAAADLKKFERKKK